MIIVTVINFKWGAGLVVPQADPVKMDFFAKTVKGFQPLTIFAKYFISDAWLGSEWVSEITSFR